MGSTEQIPPSMSQEMRDSGVPVASFHARSAVTELWCNALAQDSDEQVDWGYFAGHVVVYHLGTEEGRQKVIRMIEGRPHPGETGIRFYRERMAP